MFDEKSAGKTLWDIRNLIGHGSLDVLNEAETRVLILRVDELEKIARRHLQLILSSLIHEEIFPKPRLPILVLPASQAITRPGSEYMGSTDMAEQYANVETLSSSYVRVRF
jgi:hypothetical protein